MKKWGFAAIALAFIGVLAVHAQQQKSNQKRSLRPGISNKVIHTPAMTEALRLGNEASHDLYLKDYSAAEKKLRKAITLQPETMLYLELAKTLDAEGKSEEAYPYFQLALGAHGKDTGVISGFPGDVVAQAHYGLMAWQKGDLATANQMCLKLGQVSSTSPSGIARRSTYDPAAVDTPLLPATLHLFLGRALIKQGKTQEALASFEQAAKLAPHEADMQYWLGQGLQKAGRTGEAGAAFDKAERLGGPDIKAAVENKL